MSIIGGSVWLTDNQVNAYTGPGPLITDDHPLIEYFMLDGLGSDTARPTLFVHRLWLVLTGLLALLIIGAAVDSASRRRTRAAM